MLQTILITIFTLTNIVNDIIITIFTLANIVNKIIIRMRSCGSALESRLEAITGDISVPGFGLDEQDLK